MSKCCCIRMQVRRLCRGPCFGDPALTAEDADWRNSDDEAPAAWSAPAEDTLQPAADAGKPGQRPHTGQCRHSRHDWLIASILPW